MRFSDESDADYSIEISHISPYGIEGTDRDPRNPISRALDRFLRSGKPPGKITHVYFIDNRGVWRWFGLITASEGDRLIFYPGFRESYDGILQYRRDTMGLQHKGSKGFPIDHLTLESNLLSMHFTAPGSEHHVGPFSTSPLGEGRYLWFGLSIRAPEIFRTVRKQTTAVAGAPPTDSKRRLEVFVKAVDGQAFQGLEMPSDYQHSSSFVHISGRRGLRFR